MHKIRRKNNIIKREKVKKQKAKEQMTKSNYPNNLKGALKRDYKYWNNQPVKKLNEIVSIDGIVNDKLLESVNDNKLELPDGFKWVDLDVRNKENSEKVSNFLIDNYLEDKDGEFSLYYSSEFLEWALITPNYDPELMLGVETDSGILIGFISGIFNEIQLNQHKLKVAEINFLCVHKKMRNKRLTPKLIDEITRRIKLKGVDKAIYTAVNYLPSPFSTVRFYHRALNIDKLLETNFTSFDKNANLDNIKLSLNLPDNPRSKNFVKLEEKYFDQTFNLLNKYLERYQCHPIFTKNEFIHKFNNKFVTAYVLLDDNDNVLDFISYYKLPSKVIKSKNKFIKTGYLYYYTSDIETVYRLLGDILIIAKNEGMDVFNALNIMEHGKILNDLKFQEGTGKLHYYMYNWKCQNISSSSVANIFI